MILPTSLFVEMGAMKCVNLQVGMFQPLQAAFLSEVLA